MSLRHFYIRQLTSARCFFAHVLHCSQSRTKTEKYMHLQCLMHHVANTASASLLVGCFAIINHDIYLLHLCASSRGTVSDKFPFAA